MSNPYIGFNNSFVPGYSEPFNQCGCGYLEACSDEPQQAVVVERVTRVAKNGRKETIDRIAPVGQFYQSIMHRPFSTWDGQLALNDLYYRKSKQYASSSSGATQSASSNLALPAICDRPLAGAALCSAQGGAQCNP
jgi:hypothetical protein